MMWITPFEAWISAFTTLALFTMTVPSLVLIVTLCPFRVLAEESLMTSAAC